MFTMLKAIFNELASIDAMLASIASIMEMHDDAAAMTIKSAASNEKRAVDLYEEAVKEHGRD